MKPNSRNWHKPVGQIWRSGRARLDLSVDEAAEALGIKPGSLRNIESEQPRATVSERLAYRAERLYDVAVDELVRVVGGGSEGRPDEPPKQPSRPTSPPKRQGQEQERKAPRRAVA